ncbi:hypothetical protein PQR75_26330 [Paraburkholderia fungorum]|uniref:hypothetical protein n=1 Tax=Paraburkholderia fungorum TaxID=134537 RepID=UPI0038B87C08
MAERTYTRSQLLAAFQEWEIAVRSDRNAFKSLDEIAAMTPGQAAEESVAAIDSYIDALTRP